MLLYFEFEDRKLNAEVNWPKNENGTVTVQINDSRLAREMPTDLVFELKNGNKISYTLESAHNKRLIELQRVLGKRLQEVA